LFTGLIKAVGTILEKKPNQLKVETSLTAELKLGDSIAVNGVCLTASDLGTNWFRADIMPETLKSTNLGDLKPGDPVNLEPALALGDRLGGHIVSGHVDAVGYINSLSRQDNAIILKITVPRPLTRFIAPKGSVAVNGVSLTIQATSGVEFTISLIPHTIQGTTFTTIKPGDPVNIEADLLARYVANLLDQGNDGGITEGFLAEHGFYK
jgi:riboflavin synthase